MRYLRLAVWLFVETLVRPHVQDHAAALTLEALFVPYLQQLRFTINGISRRTIAFRTIIITDLRNLQTRQFANRRLRQNRQV